MTTNSPAVRRSEHNRFPSSRRPRTALALLSAAFTAAMLVSAGCVGYRLGSTLPADLKSIHVPTFVNQAGEPELESETTKAAIREFQKDGNLRVVNAGESDSVLEVTLVKYWLEPIRYERDSTKTTREYRAKLAADIVFTRASNSEVILKRRVEGEATFIVTDDLAAGKRAVLPDLSRDLAHNIVEGVVEFW